MQEVNITHQKGAINQERLYNRWLMSSLLESYELRHREMSKSEKVGNAKNMLTIARHFAPKWAQAVETVYRYIRIIDDAVDESPYIQPVKEQLAIEKQALLDGTYRTPLQQKYLSETVGDYFQDKKNIISRNLSLILKGLSLDLQIRDTQQPFTSRQLVARNFLDIWPCFAIFSIGTTHVNPKPTFETVQLIDAFATYDNISDTPEDLSHGLNLIPKEDLERYGLHFINNQPLPIEQLVQYHRSKGGVIAPRLREYSAAFFHTGMPSWLAVLSYIYFYTRSFKLLKALSIQEGLTYKIPKDAQFLTI